MNISHRFPQVFKRSYRLLLVVMVVLALLWYIPGLVGGNPGQPGAPFSAAAAGDPVIAAAGDIACDPANSVFNNGQGNSNSCRQLYTSNLLVNAGLAAVLDLGDNQYYCGGDQAFLQSYDLSWGRVKSITHPSVGNHEYLTSGGTGCNPANANAAGYFQYFGAAAGTQGQGWYSFDVGKLAPDCIEFELLKCGRMCLGFASIQIFAGRPGCPPEPVHAGFLAYPAVQLRWATSRQFQVVLDLALQCPCRCHPERA